MGSVQLSIFDFHTWRLIITGDLIGKYCLVHHCYSLLFQLWFYRTLQVIQVMKVFCALFKIFIKSAESKVKQTFSVPSLHLQIYCDCRKDRITIIEREQEEQKEMEKEIEDKRMAEERRKQSLKVCNGWDMSLGTALQPLQGLLSWYPVMYSSHCNSFENWTPVDEICECPIFRWVAVTWPKDNCPGNDSVDDTPYFTTSVVIPS